MAISTPMLVTFLVYIFGMILIGFLAWRSTKNFDDYILGGRSLGPMVTALCGRIGHERLAADGAAGRDFHLRYL
jgi:Na+/pantothenate symporter